MLIREWSLARAMLLSLILLPLAADAAEPYQISARVWIDGELRGTPTLMVPSEETATIEVGNGAGAWRMSIRVEHPREHEAADPGGIWMTVGLDQKVGEDWEHLTETLIGTPLGEPGRISVVAPDAPAEATPEQAQLYVELVARKPAADDRPEG